MSITCVVVPYFAAAVERRANPALHDTPIVLHANEAVYAASAEAVQCGVRVDMPLRSARTLLPSAHLLLAEPSRYRAAADKLRNALSAFSHRIELAAVASPTPTTKANTKKTLSPESLDSQSAFYYLELGKLRAADLEALAYHIVEAVQKTTGYAVAVGVSRGKFPALVAANCAGPAQALVIPAGNEGLFLSGLPIAVLGLDKEMSRRLRLLGITTLGHLAALPAGAVSTRFGSGGARLRSLAAGVDTRPVIPHVPGPVARAAQRFEGAVESRSVLEASLSRLSDTLSARLQAEALAARAVEVLLVQENGRTHERRIRLRQAVSSAARLRMSLWQALAQMSIRGGVVAVEVTAIDLVRGSASQLELFAHNSVHETRLHNTLTELSARYGAACFYWSKLTNSRLPGQVAVFEPVML